MFKNTKNGFTLIELLVVIAIIGILASVVLASLNSARKKSRDARRVADVKQIQLALEMYYDSKGGSYPLTLSLLAPDYIPVVPNDPLGTAVAYSYSPLGTASSCSSYHLGASLEEGPTNPPLSSDSDATAGTACTFGGTGAADFAGADAGKCADAHTGTYCYDVKP